MKICIIQGADGSDEFVEPIAKNWKNKGADVRLGISNIDHTFLGSNISDFTNLSEYDYFKKEKKKKDIADIYVFLDSDFKSIKSISRILRSIEYNEISISKIVLVRNTKWNSFLNMLRKTFVENNEVDILAKIEICEVDQLSSLLENDLN